MTKPYSKIFELKFFSHLILILLSFGILTIPLVTGFNNYTLGRGWDLPKVNLLMQLLVLLSFLILVQKTYLISINRLNFSRAKKILLPIVLLTYLFIVTINSSWTRNLDPDTELNSIYKFLFHNILGKTELIEVNQSLVGNAFRETGFVFYFILLVSLFLISSYINKDTIKYIFLAFITSSILQSFIGLNQFYR
ncbi:MAG: hypothetical protein Q9M91_08045, partial [Candidatus Dojkabacteria bacterium]|nr:hypothetical protein [Candidatus Dojkabacteria bacterium]